METGSESYQAQAIMALAEVIKVIGEDMHPTYMELCVQVALTLLKRDHDGDVTPAALYLLGIICFAGPSKADFGRTFVRGGGNKLLLKALPNSSRNEALFVILTIDDCRPELEAVMDAIVKESSTQSLADLYRDYPPHPVDDDTLISPEALSEAYQVLHGRMPDSWTLTPSRYLRKLHAHTQ